ncbi:MAG: aminotransferase, partial [Actinomycetota bacterium]
MDRARAQTLDANDPLREFKKRFVITDPATCYLDGNSLGRLPHATVKAVNDFLHDEWAREVVVGWGHWIDEAQTTGNLIGRSA